MTAAQTSLTPCSHPKANPLSLFWILTCEDTPVHGVYVGRDNGPSIILNGVSFARFRARQIYAGPTRLHLFLRLCSWASCFPAAKTATAEQGLRESHPRVFRELASRRPRILTG